MTVESIKESRVHVRLKGVIAEYFESVIGPQGLYENQSEYIRALIRRDMAQLPSYDVASGLLEGYEQLATGHYRKRPMSEIIKRAEQELRDEANGQL